MPPVRRHIVERVVEQVRHGRVVTVRGAVVDEAHKIHWHVAELQAHGVVSQCEVGTGGQAHQVVARTNQIRAVRGVHVAQNRVTVAFHGEFGVALRHRAGVVEDLDAGGAVIAQRAQRFTTYLHGLPGLDAGQIRPIHADHPFRRCLLITAHRGTFLSSSGHALHHCTQHAQSSTAAANRSYSRQSIAIHGVSPGTRRVFTPD